MEWLIANQWVLVVVALAVPALVKYFPALGAFLGKSKVDDIFLEVLNALLKAKGLQPVKIPVDAPTDVLAELKAKLDKLVEDKTASLRDKLNKLLTADAKTEAKAESPDTQK